MSSTSSDSSENGEKLDKMTERRQRLAQDMNPNFENDVGLLARDYWEDWMRVLREENNRRMDKTDEEFMDFLTLESVEYIFTICVRMRLPHETRFIAALVFEEFMRKQTVGLFRFIADSKLSKRKKEEEWAKIETNLSRQIPLRVVSAIQIATKDVQYHTSLSSHDIAQLLRTLGYAYTQRAIAKSELRILSLLDWKIPKTPSVICESLLKFLGDYKEEELGISEPLNMTSCWDHILLFLDIYFLHHELYTTTLLENITKQNTFNRQTRATLKADFMLLGASIVAAAVSVVYDHNAADNVVPILEKITGGVPAVDIIEVCIALVEITKKLARASKKGLGTSGTVEMANDSGISQ